MELRSTVSLFVSWEHSVHKFRSSKSAHWVLLSLLVCVTLWFILKPKTHELWMHFDVQIFIEWILGCRCGERCIPIDTVEARYGGSSEKSVAAKKGFSNLNRAMIPPNWGSKKWRIDDNQICLGHYLITLTHLCSMWFEVRIECLHHVKFTFWKFKILYFSDDDIINKAELFGK